MRGLGAVDAQTRVKHGVKQVYGGVDDDKNLLDNETSKSVKDQEEKVSERSNFSSVNDKSTDSSVSQASSDNGGQK